MIIRNILFLGLIASFLSACASGAQQGQANKGPQATLENEPWAAVYKVALRMEDTGDIRSAEKLYLQSLSQKKDFEPAIEGLERVSMKAEDELLRMAIQGHRVSLGGASKLQRRAYARGLLGAGYAEEAARQFKILIDLGGNGQDYSLHGLALDHLGRHAQARVEYDKALDKAYESPQLLNNKALSLALSGRYEDAAEVLAPLATGNNRAIILNQAAFLDLAGKHDKALALLDGKQGALDRTLKQFRSLKAAIETGRYASKDFPQLQF